ncbi:unnamed protein product, partial [Ectocarpus sp. 4 AP-2014]
FHPEATSSAPRGVVSPSARAPSCRVLVVCALRRSPISRGRSIGGGGAKRGERGFRKVDVVVQAISRPREPTASARSRSCHLLRPPSRTGPIRSPRVQRPFRGLLVGGSKSKNREPDRHGQPVAAIGSATRRAPASARSGSPGIRHFHHVRRRQRVRRTGDGRDRGREKRRRWAEGLTVGGGPKRESQPAWQQRRWRENAVSVVGNAVAATTLVKGVRPTRRGWGGHRRCHLRPRRTR